MHTKSGEWKSGECLRKGGSLSYSRLRELLLEKISSLGMDPKLFGMHSLRVGNVPQQPLMLECLIGYSSRWEMEV